MFRNYKRKRALLAWCVLSFSTRHVHAFLANRPVKVSVSVRETTNSGPNGDAGLGEASRESKVSQIDDPTTSVWDCTIQQTPDERHIAKLKVEIYKLAAAYNRGYAASPRARESMERLIEELESFNMQDAAAVGVTGDLNGISCPLAGSWRMLWTTGQDVLVLDANPLVTTCAIHQVFEPPVVTNIIDLQPKAQALLPPATIGNSLLRARVVTRANQREGRPNRVGLVFERVQLQPLQFLGSDIDIFPPLGFDLPRFGAASTEPTNPDSPGYFEVTFLDDEVLVYRQQLAGKFLFIKVDNIDA